MTVYVVATIDITDREGYAAYEAGFMAIFDAHQGTLLAVDEAPVEIEGRWPSTRTVLASFPDQASFEAWYHSDAYQALAQHRLAASSADIVMLQGLPTAE